MGTRNAGRWLGSVGWVVALGCATSSSPGASDPFGPGPDGSSAPWSQDGDPSTAAGDGDDSTGDGTNAGDGRPGQDGAAGDGEPGDGEDGCTGTGCSDGAGGGPVDPADDPAFQGPSTCSSGVMWILGNVKSELMRPGLACNDCHRSMFQEVYTIAGTLYATGHEPDDCSGVSGLSSDAKIEIKDATGKVVTLSPNLSGNFRTSERLTFPITTRVLSGGQVRVMEGEVDAAGGDCNTCHTDAGDQDAPGRIALP